MHQTNSDQGDRHVRADACITRSGSAAAKSSAVSNSSAAGCPFHCVPNPRFCAAVDGEYEFAAVVHDGLGDRHLADHCVDRDRPSVSASCFSSLGIAVISLDFSSVATWPSVRPSSSAQALTMSSGPNHHSPPCTTFSGRRLHTTVATEECTRRTRASHPVRAIMAPTRNSAGTGMLRRTWIP